MGNSETMKSLNMARTLLANTFTDITLLRIGLPIISDIEKILVESVQAIDDEIEKLEIDSEIVADSLNE